MSESASPRADRAVLLELAERVERDGPNYATECDIEKAVFGASDGLYHGTVRIGMGGPRPPRKFTTAVDAALLLLPDGDDVFWRVGHDGEGPDPSLFRADVLLCRLASPTDGFVERARTPALALCAAALRARAA